MRTRVVLPLVLPAVVVACGGARNRPDGNAELPAVCAEFPAESVWLWDDPEPPAPWWPAQEHAVLVYGATLLTAAGDDAPIVEEGYVYFEDGRIVAVGSGTFDGATPDAERIDAAGMWVTPGLIDTHSHLGVYPTPYAVAHSDGNEATAPITAEVEAVDSVWPEDPGFERAIAGGITTMQILPGSANLIGGRGVVIKLHRGARHGNDLRFPGAPETVKMACGENPKRVYGEIGGPSTRMGSITTVRQAFADAEDYRESWEDWHTDMVEWCAAGAPEDEEPTEPTRSLQSDTLAGILAGVYLPEIHCYRADEMLAQMEIAEEFGFHIRGFHHALEAYKIRDILAEERISVSTWADWWGFKLEAWDGIPENAALVTEAGGIAVIHSDSPIGTQRLNQEAAKAWASGDEAGVALSPDDVIRWISWNPAWTLGVEDETGSLEPGKMADIVIWSGDPFSVYSTAVRVFVDGVEEWNRELDAPPWSDFEAGWDWTPDQGGVR